MSRQGVLLAAALASMPAGCVRSTTPEPPAPACVFDCVQPSTSGLDGQGGEISLLRSGLLTPPNDKDPGYSFYVYLYFSDESDDYEPERFQAAKAAVKPYRGAVSELVGKTNADAAGRSEAIFYIPIGTHPQQKLIASVNSPGTLLDTYDYGRARDLARLVEDAFGVTPPRVGLIASQHPLHITGKPNLSEVYLVSLEGRLEDIERKILGFQTKLLSPSESIKDDVAVLSRDYLESVDARPLQPQP